MKRLFVKNGDVVITINEPMLFELRYLLREFWAIIDLPQPELFELSDRIKVVLDQIEEVADEAEKDAKK